MKKILSVIVFVVLALFTVTHFLGERKAKLENVREVERRFLKMGAKQAFYEKPTLLEIEPESEEFIEVDLECGRLLVRDVYANEAEYDCVDGRIQVFIFESRLFLNYRSGGEGDVSPNENFNFLINAVYTLPDYQAMRKMRQSTFEYTVGLLANKWFLYRKNDGIFHVKVGDSLEMILAPPGEREGLWDAMAFSDGKFYTVILHPKDPNVGVEEVAKFIASFRLR